MTNLTTAKNKLRHEFKHIINRHDDLIVSGRLKKIFRHDENAGSHGVYRVSSLYFDTPHDRALREKLDGVNRREKFRIRFYNDDHSFIKLEKKSKINGLCLKESARITKQETERIIAGDTDFLLSGGKLYRELYSKMRSQLLAPKTIVVYDREAFIYEPGNVRITLDRNVRSGMRSLDFFGDIPLVDMSEGMTVLEVKYDEFLPDIAAMAVSLEGRRASAYSKYAVSRMYE